MGRLLDLATTDRGSSKKPQAAAAAEKCVFEHNIECLVTYLGRGHSDCIGLGGVKTVKQPCPSPR